MVPTTMDVEQTWIRMMDDMTMSRWTKLTIIDVGTETTVIAGDDEESKAYLWKQLDLHLSRFAFGLINDYYH